MLSPSRYLLGVGLVSLLAACGPSLTSGVGVPAGPRLLGRADGSVVEWVEAGSGETVMVLIHGFGDTLATWGRVMGPLAQRFRVVAYNTRGMGRSRPAGPLGEASFAVNDYVGELRDLLAAVKGKRVILVGNSMGAQIALAFAARYPEQVAGLGLIDPSGGSMVGPSLGPTMRMVFNVVLESTPDPRAITAFVRWVLGSIVADASRVDEAMVMRHSGPYLDRTARQALVRVMGGFALANPERLYRARLGARRSRGQSLSHQVLLIWGAKDPWFPVEGKSAYEQALPGVMTRVLPQAGHLPQEEQPEAVSQALISLFSSDDGGRVTPVAVTEAELVKDLAAADAGAMHAAMALGDLGDRLSPAGLSALIPAAASSRDHLAKAAREALVALAPRSLPVLEQALGRSEWRVVRAAATVLGQAGPEGTAILHRALAAAPPGRRADLVAGLGGSAADRPLLLEALASTDPAERQAAVHGLGELRDPSTVPALVKALGADANLGLWTTLALVAIGRSGVPSLIKALPEAPAEVQARLAEALGRLGDERAVPALLDLGPKVSAAAQALAAIVGGTELARALASPDAARRRMAIAALYSQARAYRHQPERMAEARPALAKALSDADSEVASMAATALGLLGDAQGATILADRITAAPDGASRSSAEVAALCTACRPALLEAWSRATKPGAKESFMRALAGVGDMAAVDALATTWLGAEGFGQYLLVEPMRRAGAAVSDFPRRVLTARLLQGLVASYTEPPAPVVLSLASLLGEFHGADLAAWQAAVHRVLLSGRPPEATVQALVSQARSDNPVQAAAALRALALLPDPSVPERLGELFSRRPRASAEALVDIGDERAAEVLTQALRRLPSEDCTTRAALGQALAAQPSLALLPLSVAMLSLHGCLGPSCFLGACREPALLEALGRSLRRLGQPGLSALARLVETKRDRYAGVGLALIGTEAAIQTLLRLADGAGRGIAAPGLAICADPACQQRLEALAAEADPNVREEVAHAMGRLSEARLTAPLLGLMSDRETRVRQAAARSLALLGFKATAPVIRPALKDLDSIVRARAAEALGTLLDEAALPGLAMAARDPESLVRQSAATALSRFGAKATPALLAALKAASATDATESLVLALGDTRDSAAAPALLALVRKGPLRCAAAQALPMLLPENDPPEALTQALLSLLALGNPSDPFKDPTTFAVRGLVAAGPRAARIVLIALADRQPRVRERAAYILGEIRCPNPAACQAALIRAVSDPMASVRAAAVRSLGSSTQASVEGARRLTAALSDTEAQVRYSAIDALGQMGKRTQAPAEQVTEAEKGLVSALKDPRGDYRRKALEALCTMKRACGKTELQAALDDSAPELRALAADMLAEGNDKTAGPALLARLSDPDSRVRNAAARALGSLGVAEAKEPLLKALEQGQIVEGAIMALAQLGEQRAIPLIRRYQFSSDENLRRLMMDALHLLGTSVGQ